MNDNDTDVSPLFQTSNGDTAISVLRDFFGGIVDKLTTVSGSGYSGSTAITTVLTVFNLFMWFIAVIVVSYTVYTALFQTTRDGEAAGRSTDRRSTALRITLALFGLMPVAGGLTVVEVFFIQCFIWSSSVASYAETKEANYLVTNSASYIAHDDLSTNWQGGQKIAGALDAMVRGHLCALYANRVSQDLQTGSGVMSSAITERSVGMFDNNSSAISNHVLEWGFTTGTQYQKLSDMCGRIQIYSVMNTDAVKATGSGQITSAGSIDDKFGALAQDEILSSARNALQSLDNSATNIAQVIYDHKWDSDAIKQQIITAVRKATTQYYSGAAFGATDTKALGDSVFASIKQDGWIWAPLWQRVLTRYAVGMAHAKDAVEFRVNGDVNPKAAGSLSARYFGWAGGGSAEERAVFSDIDRSFDYLQTFSGTYANVASPENMSQGTNFERMSAADEKSEWVAPIHWLYNYLLATTKPALGQSWSDPFLAIQAVGDEYMEIGGSLSALGASGAASAGFAAAGAAASTAISGNPMTGAYAGYKVGNAIDGFVTPVGHFLMGCGVLLAGVIPLFPLLFFFSGVLAWFTMLTEAVVAGNLWCILGLLPSQNDSIVGENKQGLLLLLAVILRPILMILGLIVCYVFIFVGINLLNRMWSTVMSTVVGGSMAAILTAVAGLGMYVLMVGTIVTTGCGLITGLGDAVMQWIGAGVSSLGRSPVADKVSSTLDPSSNIGSGAHSAPGRGMQVAAQKMGKDFGKTKEAKTSPARFGALQGAKIGRMVRKGFPK